MLILRIMALWMPVVGIGGIVGAIETGTSPVNAVIVFLAGCALMGLYSVLDRRRYRRNREIDRFMKRKKMKEPAGGNQADSKNLTNFIIRESEEKSKWKESKSTSLK